jgi:hypothetical protein
LLRDGECITLSPPGLTDIVQCFSNGFRSGLLDWNLKLAQVGEPTRNAILVG